jgi:K+-sensing histidine kinase KdpD
MSSTRANDSFKNNAFSSRRPQAINDRHAKLDQTRKSEIVMRRAQSRSDVIAVFAGILLPVAVCAILIPFRLSFVDTASALVLVAVIVAIATIGNRLAGFVAAISASLWFDFFLTQPYYRFAITHRPDIEITVSLFIVGIVVTELAARNRFHRRVAEEETDYVGLIYYLSELVAAGTSAKQVIAQATAELTDLLHLRNCQYVEGSSNRRVPYIEHDGTVNLGRLRWGVRQMGLPGTELELLVQGQGQIFGRFVLEPTPGQPVSVQRRIVALAIADQVGAALTPHPPSM